MLKEGNTLFYIYFENNVLHTRTCIDKIGAECHVSLKITAPWGKGWDKTRLAGEAWRKACGSGAREASRCQSQSLEGKVTVFILLTVFMINSFTIYFNHSSTMCQQNECGLQLMLQQTSENFLLASDSACGSCASREVIQCDTVKQILYCLIVRWRMTTA